MSKSVIFLTFANDLQVHGQFLKALEPERTVLHRELSKYQEKGWGLYHSAGSSDPKELQTDLRQHSGRLSIFHFAGHADGTHLQLEGSDDTAIELASSNLLAFLKEEPQLKLVVLNACGTKDHIQRLFEIGVPAVIATETSIKDRKARDFSEAFYGGLVQGKSLQTAFEVAKAVVNPESNDSRIYRDRMGLAEEEEQFPWGLHVQGEDVLEWTLDADIQEKRPIWRYTMILLGLLGIIAAVSGLNLKELFLPDQPLDNSVTVLVDPGLHKLPENGIVYLLYGNTKVPKQIDNKGEAVFLQIPDLYFEEGSTANIQFEDPNQGTLVMGEPYRALFPDSAYQLSRGQAISLRIGYPGLGMIKGFVKHSHTGEPVSGASVQVQDLSATSDELGYFVLPIPEDRQQPTQTVRTSKEGFQPRINKGYPVHASQEIIIRLKPE